MDVQGQKERNIYVKHSNTQHAQSTTASVIENRKYPNNSVHRNKYANTSSHIWATAQVHNNMYTLATHTTQSLSRNK